MFRRPAHFGTDPLLTTSTNSSPPLAGTLTQRLLRLWPYFRSAKTGIALAAISTLIGALTEPLIPALLKTLLDRGFAEGNIELWMVPVALMGLFGIRGLAGFVAQYAHEKKISIGEVPLAIASRELKLPLIGWTKDMAEEAGKLLGDIEASRAPDRTLVFKSKRYERISMQIIKKASAFVDYAR